MENDTVRRSIWIAAPPDRAWQAVTKPEHLDQWYATCCTWEIPALRVGATVKFANTETDILTATIEVVDPPHEFTLRWQPNADNPLVTLVTTFLLEAENGGTRVSIIESGYEALSVDERKAWMDAAGEGYTMSMENLKALLEGKPIPYV